MGTLRARAAVVAAVVALASACGGEGGQPASTPAETPTTTTPTPAPTAAPSTGPPPASPPASPTGGPATAVETEAVLDDGRHPAHIVAVDTSARTVTVDVVQWFTGAAAASAAAEDGADEVPPPNDYWVRNENPRLRTLTVAGGARITTNTLTSEQTGSATQDVRVSLDRLAAADGLPAALFWVTVQDGQVVAVAEQYLP